MAILGISVKDDREADALKFRERFQIPYPLAWDANGAAARAYGVEGTPTTYVIDRAGRVAAASVGSLEPAQLERLLESALAKS